MESKLLQPEPAVGDEGPPPPAGDVGEPRADDDGPVPIVEPAVVPLDLDPLPETPQYEIPPKVLETLEAHSMVLLGGQPAVHVAALARQTARHVVMRQSPAAGPVMPVWEWTRDSGIQQLIAAIGETPHPSVFVLPDVSPREVDFAIDKLAAVINTTAHSLILSTSHPLSRWHLQDRERHLWPEWSEHDVFPTFSLLQHLESTAGELGVPDPLARLDDNRRVRVLRTLGTPVRVRRFVELAGEHGADSAQGPALTRLVATAVERDSAVASWFETLGTEPGAAPRGRLLATALALLSGLSLDQLCAAVDVLNERAWRRRFPGLADFDLDEFGPFHNFFSIPAAERAHLRVEPRFAGLQLQLLRQVLSSNRQLLRACAVCVVEMVEESADPAARGAELYGTERRIRRLHQVAARACGELLACDPLLAQGLVWRLATNPAPSVRTVAALALAFLREHGDDNGLPQWLERADGDVDPLVRLAAMSGAEVADATAARDAVRGTLARAAGEASLYDPPNRVPPWLLAVLRTMSHSSRRPIVAALREHTLPLVTGAHAAQLRTEGLLDEWSAHASYTSAMGAGMARALFRQSEIVIATLDEWTRAGQEEPARLSGLDRATPRESRLATVAASYGAIDFSVRYERLDAAGAMANIREILRQEAHPGVRSAMLRAVVGQAGRNFADVQAELQHLVGELSQEERDEIVSLLRELYCDQRAALGGGDCVFRFGRHRIESWRNPQDRPRTPIEKAMQRWIKVAEVPAAKQLATRALVEFVNAVDFLEEEKLAELRRQELERRDELPDGILEIRRDKERVGLYLREVAPRLATLRARGLRPVVSDLLPEVLKQRGMYRDATEFLMAQWQRGSDEEIQRIGERLQSAVKWVDRRPWLLALAGLAIAASGAAVALLLR